MDKLPINWCRISSIDTIVGWLQKIIFNFRKDVTQNGCSLVKLTFCHPFSLGTRKYIHSWSTFPAMLVYRSVLRISKCWIILEGFGRGSSVSPNIFLHENEITWDQNSHWFLLDSSLPFSSSAFVKQLSQTFGSSLFMLFLVTLFSCHLLLEGSSTLASG